MSELRQAVNEVVISGVVLEKDIEEKTIKGKQAITGEVTIETGANSVHTVNLFSYLMTKAGKENGFAKGIATLRDELKTVKDNGRDEADSVTTYQANLSKNEYIAQDGGLRSYDRISANSLNRTKVGETINPQSTFKLETFIQAILPEIKNEEETGRMVIKGVVALYGGKVALVDLIVSGDKNVAFVEQNYEVGNTVLLTGEIVNTVETKTHVQEMAFGDDVETIETKTVRELLITGGSFPHEEEDAYSVDTIKKALAQRDITIEEMKEKAKDKQSSGAGKSTGATGGFGDMSTSAKEEYDIPF